MGSRGDAIVAYGSLSRSRSRSKSRSRRRKSRSRRRRSRSRSEVKSKTITFQSEEGRIAAEKVTAQRFAKEQAAARVQAATKAVEASQKALEDAMAADVEAAKKLQELTQEASRIDRKDTIQKLVDDREEARRGKNFDKTQDLQSELRGLGVQVNDNTLTWSGPGGLEGKIKGGVQSRPGDWHCPECGVLVFSSKRIAYKCWKCGAPNPNIEGGGGGGGGGGRGRRSPSYDRRKDRRRDRDDSRDKRRRKRSPSRRSPSRRRRRSPSSDCYADPP